MAFELATKFVKLMSKLPEDSKLNVYTLISRLWLICARCHYIVVSIKNNKGLVVVLQIHYYSWDTNFLGFQGNNPKKGITFL